MIWFLTGKTSLRSLFQGNVRIWSAWPLDRYRKAIGEAISQANFEARILSDGNFYNRWDRLDHKAFPGFALGTGTLPYSSALNTLVSRKGCAGIPPLTHLKQAHRNF